MFDNKYTKLTILFTSDIHGNVFPINYGNNREADVGLGKIATLINEERMKNEPILLIDNGDLIQGTPLAYHAVQFSTGKKNPMIKVLNHLSYDAAVIGNHEFNYGLTILNQAVKESTFPWLSANIVHTNNNEPYFGRPYLIKNIDNIRVAILGITTHYIPNWENPAHIVNLTFKDALEDTKKWVASIKNVENPDIIIVSYHGGFECDLESGKPTEVLTGENQAYRMCTEVDGIDVLLTGHQHRSLAGSVNGVTIAQPSVNGQALGKITLILDQKKKIVEKTSKLLCTEKVAADPTILDLVKDYEEETQEWLDQPIGYIDGDMMIHDAMNIRLSDNPLIEFINKVQMEAAGVNISNTALFNNASIGFPKHVTMRDIASNYIYPNTLKVLRITGLDIKNALEQSASYFMINEEGKVEVNPSFVYPKPQHYNYDMWEGIQYVLNISQPIGDRVMELNIEGKPIELQAEYDVVMNNYRAGGGGNYTMYKDKPVIKEIPISMSELIANYLLKRKTVLATNNRNWKVIW